MVDPTCPGCGAELAEPVVLCVECGYHFGLGRRLEQQAGDVSEPRVIPSVASDHGAEPNPFAPVDLESQGAGELPLTEQAAKQARDLVDGAMPFYLVILLSICICPVYAPLMLPWNLYRLAQWRSMSQRYPQLLAPNSLSPYAEIELRFRSAGLSYLISVVLGAVVLILWLAALWSRRNLP